MAGNLGGGIDRIGRSRLGSSIRSNLLAGMVFLLLIVTTTSISVEEPYQEHHPAATTRKDPDRFPQWRMADIIIDDDDTIAKEEVEDKLADLDRVLQSSAFQSFGHPVVTGRIYNVSLENSSLGSRVTARTVRLKVGSLVHRGFTLEEFTIPTRAGPVTGVARIVLVYRRFVGKLYEPQDLTIVSPVLGIKVYDAANLSNTNAPEMEFMSRGPDNVTVRIPVSRAEVTIVPQCAEFDSMGNVSLSSVAGAASPGAASYVCSSRSLGDFALVVAAGSIAPASGPAAAPLPLTAPPEAPPSPPRRRRRRSRKWRIIVGAVVGGVAGLVLLGLLLAAAMRYRRKSRISQMEQHSDRGELLQTSLIGGSRAPTAGASRTKPVLESDYAA